ncbi:hypothetical protein PIROE2DRAFT_1186 [Piromyces sp. E2]|nr:hypothetical protein PIROE2DRAFT_1186 [Piromyces sp. E2]|eukprot:OUM70651.1 hypothetical protein PIROE2DRAFT_1186 [Piromyces sp. E2]
MLFNAIYGIILIPNIIVYIIKYSNESSFPQEDYIICSSVNSSDYNNIPIFDVTKVSITNSTEKSNSINKILRHTNFYMNESELNYIYSYPYDIDPGVNDEFRIDSTFRSQPNNGWLFGDVYQDTKKEVYHTILSDPEKLLNAFSHLFNGESNSDNNGVWNNPFINIIPFMKMSNIFARSIISQNTYLNRKMIMNTIYSNIYNNLEYRNKVPDFFSTGNADNTFQKEFLKIFLEKILYNENNLKKLLYLFQFQVNPLMIVSSRNNSYLKILEYIPKLLYFDVYQNETYNSHDDDTYIGKTDDLMKHEYFKYVSLDKEESESLLKTSLISNSSISMSIKTVPKFNYVYNLNLNNTTSSDEIDEDQYHFIDDIISTTVLNSRTRLDNYINTNYGLNYSSYFSLDFYMASLEEIKTLPFGALIINDIDKEKLNFKYTLQIGSHSYLNNLIFWPSEGFRKMVYQSWLSNAFGLFI